MAGKKDVEDVDIKNMAGELVKFPGQCEEALTLGTNLRFPQNYMPTSIAVLGMGGSGVSGDFLKAYFLEKKSTIPVYVIRDYTIPKYITKDTLVFAVSYSGNTEETVSAYREAGKLGGQTVVICSGGKLEPISREYGAKLIKVPSGMQPRLSTPYLFLPMLTILKNNGIISVKDSEIQALTQSLAKSQFQELAKGLADMIGKKIPIIYSSERFSVIAMKFKTDINENAKIQAFYNIYSEFNHNELTSYVNKMADYHIVIVTDDDDHPRIKKRMKITKDLFRKYGQTVTELNIKGDSFLSKLMSSAYVGLWLGYYLALEYDTDPTPVEIIEDLKKQLG